VNTAPVLSVSVDKLNDANGDTEFTDSERAPAPGADVTFTAKITNTSLVPVLISSLTDRVGTTDLPFTCTQNVVGTLLAAGASRTCTFTVADYAPAAGETLVNVVRVVVAEPGVSTNTASAEDDSSVNTAPVLSVSVVKTNDANGDALFTDAERASGPGAAVPFRAVVTNTSAVPVVLDSLVDAFAGSSQGVCDALVGTTLAAGASVTCDFTLTGYAPAAGQTLVNTVTVVVVEPDVPTNTATDDDTSTVTTAPVLSVVVDKLNDANGDTAFTDTETAPTAGQAVPFRAVVTNTSAVPVLVRSLTDVFGTTTLAVCADLVGTTLAAGASVTCSFTVPAYSPALGGSLVNRVTVVVEEPGTPTNTGTDFDDSTVNTTPPVRDLRIAKVDDVANAVSPGDTYSYTLTVTNDGQVAESGFVVTDTLPAELSLAGPITGSGFTCSDLVCTYGGPALAPQASVTLTVSVRLAADFDGETVLNRAAVTVPTGDPTPANNTDTETTPVVGVLAEVPVRDLQIEKTDSVASVQPGQQLAYALVVRNIGTAPVDGFTVTDPLPAGLSLVSVTGTGFTCSGSATVSCTFAGRLAVGGTASLQLVTLVAADYAGDRIVNTATVPLEGDPTPENNTDSETTPVAQEEPQIITGRSVPAAPAPAPSAPTSLPFTGGDTAVLALAALGMLLLGAGAQVLGRRSTGRGGLSAA
jgi:uncharacterized repeat protein (TIGR01451 family)